MLGRLVARVGRRLRLLGCGLERLGTARKVVQVAVATATTEPPEWEKVPFWLPAEALRGWDSAGVFETQSARWERFVELIQQPGPLGISTERGNNDGRENFSAHNLLMTYGYVLGRVLQGTPHSLKMLDWGSGCGHYYHITKTLFPNVYLQYAGFDLPGLCALGRRLLPQGMFYEDAHQATADRYDFVLAGSSLWYAEDWRKTLGQLAKAACPWIFITRMIFLERQPTCIVIQRPHKWGYETEYQCWILNRDDFLSAATDYGLQLEREFWIGPGPEIVGLSEQGAFRGFLFRRLT